MLRWLPVLWLALMGWAPLAQADLPDAITRVKPALVAVGTFQATRNPQFSFIGTGFAVGDGSLIATNGHTVPVALNAAQGERLVVAVPVDGRAAQIRPAEKHSVDEVHDVALLRLSGPALAPVSLRDGVLREGQSVAFTGFPIGQVLGLYPVTHRGVVSAISPNGNPTPRARDLSGSAIRRIAGGRFDIYQLDATAYPGGSGSPLFDPESGEVVGIINMVFVKEGRESALTAPTGISFAIPVGYLIELLRTQK